jgi:hypothetical protein
MNVLRNVNGFELNEGNGMANGLFNISHTEKELLSNWFDNDTKNELLQMSDVEFEKFAISICN